MSSDTHSAAGSSATRSAPNRHERPGAPTGRQGLRDTAGSAHAAPAGSSPARCQKCQKAEEHLWRCAACGDAVYCSPACQSEDWKAHKSTCRRLSGHTNAKKQGNEAKKLESSVQRQAGSSVQTQASTGSSQPNGSDNKSLLLTWLNLHKAAVGQAIHESMRHQYGSCRSFDFAGSCLVLQLSRNRSSGGDPGTAFVVGAAAFKTRAAAKMPSPSNAVERKYPAIDAGHRRDAKAATYAGLLRVLFQFDGGSERMIFPWPIHDVPAPPGERFTSAEEHWQQLRVVTKLGIVLRPDGNGDETDAGRMEKRGGEWRWVPRTADELTLLTLNIDL